jgi:transposase
MTRAHRSSRVACWAPYDVHASNGSGIARQALERNGALYAIEQEIRGQPPDKRRRRRQARSLPIAEALRSWAHATLAKLSGRSELAKAFRYMLAHWPALIRCFADGRLEIDNDSVERALRGVAVGRKNYLFAGSDRGSERAVAIYPLIETAKLNGVDP